MKHTDIQPIGHTRLTYSDYKDNGVTVLDALNSSEFRVGFYQAMFEVLKGLKSYERVDVYWWYAPLVYIDVIDTRYKHYPCGHRLLVSFDLTNGKLYSRDSANRHIVVRTGWVKCAERLTGQKISASDGCNDFEKRTNC